MFFCSVSFHVVGREASLLRRMKRSQMIQPFLVMRQCQFKNQGFNKLCTWKLAQNNVKIEQVWSGIKIPWQFSLSWPSATSHWCGGGGCHHSRASICQGHMDDRWEFVYSCLQSGQWTIVCKYRFWNNAGDGWRTQRWWASSCRP